MKHLPVSAELQSASSEGRMAFLQLQTCHTEALLFSLLPFLRRESPRPRLSPAPQLVPPTHLSVVRDTAETKGCSPTFTFCFIFIRQYKFCLRALRISQVGTLTT